MIASMTGYGRGEVRGEAGTLLVELRSLNHRYLEVLVRGDVESLGLAERIRAGVADHFARGRIEACLAAETGALAQRRVVVDMPLARQYRDRLSQLKDELGLEHGVRIADLLACGGLVELREERVADDTVWSLVEPALTAAITDLQAARRREGTALAEDMGQRLDRIQAALATVDARSDQVRERYRRRLLERLQEWQAAEALAAERVEAEAVLYAERSDITEELVRLQTHLHAFRQALSQDGPVGRRLEFILQELQREINTVGAKAKDAAIGTAVVDVKAELETLREQAKNIE